MSYAFTPLLALLLALTSFLAPIGNTLSPDADFPALAVTVDYPDDGSDFTAGLVETIDGQPAAFVQLQDDAFYLTGTSALLQQNGQLISIPADDLTALISGALGMLPTPTEEDAAALSCFASGLASSISKNAVSLHLMDSGVYFTLNVDQLLAELDQAVPQVLTAYAEHLDPTIRKYSTAMLGQAITCEQLAEVWPEIGLSELQTGLVLRATVQHGNDSTYISASAADMNLSCTVGRNIFNMQLTMPDGTVYAINSKHLLIVMQLLTSAPAPSTDAFNVVETSGTNVFGERTSNLVITLDTTVMARELNAGLAQVMVAESETVDWLLDSYRTWLALIDPELASLTAANLASAFENGLLTLPELKGEVVLSKNNDGVVTVDGHFSGFMGKATLTGTIFTGWDSASNITLTIDDGYDPLVFTFTSASDGWDQQLSFSSSEPIFDLFRTITLHMDDDGFVLTTDTNDIRLAYDAEEYYMEAKIGLLNAFLREDENEGIHVNLALPEFFFDLHTGDEYLNLDSTFFGFDYAETDNGMAVNGYIVPDLYDDRTVFGLATDEYLGVIQAYLKDGDVDLHLNISGYVITFSNGDDLYTITPDFANEAYIISCNGEEFITVTGEEEDDVLTLRFFEGLSTEGDPAFNVIIDMSPDAITLPEGAQPVDAQTFLQELQQFFN